MTKKEKPACKYCGSMDVVFTANVSWNSEIQDYQIDGVFDDAYCHECEEEGSPNWIQVEDS